MDNTVCRNFNSPKGCKYGDKCKYKHISGRRSYKSILVGSKNVIDNDTINKSKICRYHIGKNGCKFISRKCKFQHKRPDIFSVYIPIAIIDTYRGNRSNFMEESIRTTYITRNGKDFTLQQNITITDPHWDPLDWSIIRDESVDLPIERLIFHDSYRNGVLDSIECAWKNLLRYMEIFMHIYEIKSLPREILQYISKLYLSTYRPLEEDFSY